METLNVHCATIGPRSRRRDGTNAESPAKVLAPVVYLHQRRRLARRSTFTSEAIGRGGRTFTTEGDGPRRAMFTSGDLAQAFTIRTAGIGGGGGAELVVPATCPSTARPSITARPRRSCAVRTSSNAACTN